MDYSKFNQTMDLEGLKKDMEEASAGNTDFKDVPAGDYEIKLEKLELTESKAGKPMISCWMKILVGEYENQLLFYNQILNTGIGLHRAKEFLKSLESGEEIDFVDFVQFGKLIDTVYNSAIAKHEYLVELKYDVDKKDATKKYNRYNIKKVYDI